MLAGADRVTEALVVSRCDDHAGVDGRARAPRERLLVPASIDVEVDVHDDAAPAATRDDVLARVDVDEALSLDVAADGGPGNPSVIAAADARGARCDRARGEAQRVGRIGLERRKRGAAAPAAESEEAADDRGETPAAA